MLFSGENYLLLKQIMRLTSTPCLKLLRCPILINGALEIKFALSKFVIFPYIIVFFFFKKKNSFLAYKVQTVLGQVTRHYHFLSLSLSLTHTQKVTRLFFFNNSWGRVKFECLFSPYNQPIKLQDS